MGALLRVTDKVLGESEQRSLDTPAVSVSATSAPAKPGFAHVDFILSSKTVLQKPVSAGLVSSSFS